MSLRRRFSGLSLKISEILRRFGLSKADTAEGKILEINLSPGDEDQLYNLPEKYPDGVDVLLSCGHFKVKSTIRLPSNTRILGASDGETLIELMPYSDCHLFTNETQGTYGSNILLKRFRVVGNAGKQEKPKNYDKITFCCAVYFFDAHYVEISDISFFDIRQTAVHVTNSAHIRVVNCDCDSVGWSGLGTSNSFDVYCDVKIVNSGLDQCHSAIHIDGGVGVHCIAHVEQSTGNGIMLDSTFGELRHVLVKGSASSSKRGVSLTGSAKNRLENVVISGDYQDNHEVGIMVSNANNVVITDARISRNGEVGLLMQGRDGGNGVTVVGAEICDNPADIVELHASKCNWVFRENFEDRFDLPQVNARAIRQYVGAKPRTLHIRPPAARN